MRKISIMTSGICVGKAPGILTTRNIGSCVAVAIYNPPQRTGGLCHIAQPEKTGDRPERNLNRYAGAAIGSVVRQMENMQCLTFFSTAKIAGGANMFGVEEGLLCDIGPANVKAVRQALKRYGIAIAGEDVLGRDCRHVIFDLADGSVRVSGPQREMRII